ncbi:MAG TPA: TIGR01906 family membrane protein [Anaerolineae bacterium]|nr:TIGR01906 family membrane protein [Anaerolineae bacterium]HID85427.1 TIGR01906 family membrane protein [Anaerolineales bacterium]
MRQVFSWLISLAVVPVLVVLGLRLMLTPLYIQIEYRLPGFPPDPYGFSQADRLHWAELSRQYLLNDAPIAFLGDLRFEDGGAVFNDRELRHMADVKRVVKGALTVGYAALAFVLVLGLWAWRRGETAFYRHALARGGWLTMAFVGLIVLFSVAAFNVFFVAFHRIFFEGDTWLFNYSDTLIRLFPERFWRDAFLWEGGVTLGLAWILTRLTPLGLLPLLRQGEGGG